jgi:hypothetical protein
MSLQNTFKSFQTKQRLRWVKNSQWRVPIPELNKLFDGTKYCPSSEAPRPQGGAVRQSSRRCVCRMGFPGTQWRAGCEQRKSRSHCAPRPRLSRSGGTGHVPVNTDQDISNSMGSFSTAELLRRLYFLSECHGG